MPDCRVPSGLTIRSSGFTNVTALGFPTFFSSFQCWRETEAEPDRKGITTTSVSVTTFATMITPSLSRTLGSTTITDSLPGETSNVVALQNYFDPVVDDMLLCEDNDLARCAAWNSSIDGSSGYACGMCSVNVFPVHGMKV